MTNSVFIEKRRIRKSYRLQATLLDRDCDRNFEVVWVTGALVPLAEGQTYNALLPGPANLWRAWLAGQRPEDLRGQR